MTLHSSTSPADSAFDRFRKLRAAGELLTRAAPQLNEADTRAKLIDPVFKEILGWSEADIRREEPSQHGWADYVIGGDYAHLLVEAKRTRPSVVW